MGKVPSSENKALNSTVIRLGIISFFTDVASEMLYPITPIFLTAVLGASMASLGMIEGVAEAISGLLKTYSGSWSDRIVKRKPFVMVGYLMAALSKPLIGIAGNWGEVFFARGLDRAGKGLRSAPRDALLAESVSPQLLGAAFGWHRAMDTLGAVVGPLLAIYFLSKNPEDLRSLYFWALIPGLLSILFLFSIRERTHNPQMKEWKNPFSAWREMSPAFKKYIFAWGVFSLANSSDVFLLLKAKNSGLSTVAVILIYCAYNLTYSLSSPWLGKLSDRIERRKILVTGLLVFALVYFGFSFVNGTTVAWKIWLLFLTYGLYMGATEGIGKALAIDLTPKDLKGTSLGILGTVTGISTVFASVVAGLIWDHLGSSWTFLYG
ncbi:MAG: MFS transporter, partial [Pseudobdellovibrionaceae bacterium]